MQEEGKDDGCVSSENTQTRLREVSVKGSAVADAREKRNS